MTMLPGLIALILVLATTVGATASLRTNDKLHRLAGLTSLQHWHCNQRLAAAIDFHPRNS